MKKFFAFTLAEVLITLGIIGVVAALTIPTLIANYQKKYYATALKKNYSLILNAFQKAMVDDESIGNFSNTSLDSAFRGFDKDNMQKQINRYFSNAKVASSSQTAGNYSYGSIANPNSKKGISYKGWRIDLPQCTFWVNGPFYGIGELNIDVNGAQKGPNIAGKDFYYIRFRNNLTLDEPYYKMYYLHGKDSYNNYCRNGSGDACFYSIMDDNWEIKYKW